MKYLYETDVVQKDMQQIIDDSNIAFHKLAGKCVLITGANGMLAYYCACVLMYLNEKKDMNIKVYALVRNKQRGKARFGCFEGNPHFQMLVQDVCEPINIEGQLDYIIHAAGSASPRYIKEAPLSIIEANVKGTDNVCRLAVEKNVSNLLFTSTREVYGKVEGVEYIKESDMGVLDPMDSRSCYPESKRMAEQILRSYQVQHGLNFTNTRIAHSYGPGMEIENDGRVMSDFMSDVIHGRDIVLKSAGKAERAFCYITDAVRGMFYVLLNGSIGESYNIANETEPMIIRDTAMLMTEIFPEKGITVKFEIAEDNSGYCNYTRVGLETAKLEDMGWEPDVCLEDGVMRTVASFMQE